MKPHPSKVELSKQVVGKLVSEDKLSYNFSVTTNPLVVGFGVIG
jgi:hypothetical protein